MKPEAQRIAIAEWCGWIPVDDGMTGRNPERSFDHYSKHGNEPLPDYLNDLNAMHEAESHLDPDFERPNYMDYLETNGNRWTITHATASQRAEALLRTIGKWTDGYKEAVSK